MLFNVCGGVLLKINLAHPVSAGAHPGLYLDQMRLAQLCAPALLALWAFPSYLLFRQAFFSLSAVAQPGAAS